MRGLFELRKHIDTLILIIEIMFEGSKFPCFNGGESAIESLKERFRVCYSDQEVHLISKFNNFRQLK